MTERDPALCDGVVVFVMPGDGGFATAAGRLLEASLAALSPDTVVVVGATSPDATAAAEGRGWATIELAMPDLAAPRPRPGARGRVARMLAGVPRLAVALRRHDVGLVLTNGLATSPVAAMAASLLDVPHMWWLHEQPEDLVFDMGRRRAMVLTARVSRRLPVTSAELRRPWTSRRSRTHMPLTGTEALTAAAAIQALISASGAGPRARSHVERLTPRLQRRLPSRGHRVPFSAPTVQRWRNDMVRVDEVLALRASAVPLPRPFVLETISVLVSCHGHPEFLADMVASINAQTLPEFEVVFVEDHSPDDTWDRLEQLLPTLRSGITWRLEQTPHNSAMTGALNLAATFATGDTYMIMNDDDVMRPDALELALGVLNADPDLLCVAGRVEGVPRDARGVDLLTTTARVDLVADPGAVSRHRHVPADAERWQWGSDMPMCHPGTTIPAAVFHAVGGYDNDIDNRVHASDDRDLHLRIAVHGPVAVLQHALVWWRQDTASHYDLERGI